MILSDAPVPYGTTRKASIALDLEGNLGSVIDLPSALLERAVRNVASRARNVTDPRRLLDVLGLLPHTATGAIREGAEQ